MSIEIPVLLNFYIRPSSNSTVIRSIVLKEYFRKLTTNVEVLYPTQVHHGLLLCKSKRTEEKILNMRHILSDGSTLQLSQLTRSLFQPIQCIINGQLVQINEINQALQQAIPFLHASEGKLQVNPDGSMIFEGQISVLNSIHSYLMNKLSNSKSSKSSDALELRTGNVTVKVIIGNLFEQNVESILIPINDKCKIHKAFDRQIQALGGGNLLNYFKDLSLKGTRTHEGEMIIYPNRDLKIPAKHFLFFTVPRLSHSDSMKDKRMIDNYQPIYEQLISRMFETIEKNSINSLALPVLEPNMKSTTDRRHANEMTVRAMISAIRQFSLNGTGKLQRIVIIDHHSSIKRLNKCVKKYQKQFPSKSSPNRIDFDLDDGQSFANIFGVPKLPEMISSTSESENDGEEYQLPYVDHAQS